MYHLQDALNLLPDLDDAATTQSFASNTNDQLLVVYLSSLVRAVIALHALVDNKAVNGRAELEEGGPKENGKKSTNDAGKSPKDTTAKDTNKSK